MFKGLLNYLGLSPEKEDFNAKVEKLRAEAHLVSAQPPEPTPPMTEVKKLKKHDCGHEHKSYSIKKDGKTICRDCKEKEING